jgi:hypothetical protein
LSYLYPSKGEKEMKESEFVNASIEANHIVDCENSVLASAIKLVKAAGYDVSNKKDKPDTHHLETAKEVITETATGVGHFIRGLGRVTLESVTAAKNVVSEKTSAVVQKGK